MGKLRIPSRENFCYLGRLEYLKICLSLAERDRQREREQADSIGYSLQFIRIQFIRFLTSFTKLASEAYISKIT